MDQCFRIDAEPDLLEAWAEGETKDEELREDLNVVNATAIEGLPDVLRFELHPFDEEDMPRTVWEWPPLRSEFDRLRQNLREFILGSLEKDRIMGASNEKGDDGRGDHVDIQTEALVKYVTNAENGKKKTTNSNIISRYYFDAKDTESEEREFEAIGLLKPKEDKSGEGSAGTGATSRDSATHSGGLKVPDDFNADIKDWIVNFPGISVDNMFFHLFYLVEMERGPKQICNNCGSTDCKSAPRQRNVCNNRYCFCCERHTSDSDGCHQICRQFAQMKNKMDILDRPCTLRLPKNALSCLACCSYGHFNCGRPPQMDARKSFYLRKGSTQVKFLEALYKMNPTYEWNGRSLNGGIEDEAMRLPSRPKDERPRGAGREAESGNARGRSHRNGDGQAWADRHNRQESEYESGNRNNRKRRRDESGEGYRHEHRDRGAEDLNYGNRRGNHGKRRNASGADESYDNRSKGNSGKCAPFESKVSEAEGKWQGDSNQRNRMKSVEGTNTKHKSKNAQRQYQEQLKNIIISREVIYSTPKGNRGNDGGRRRPQVSNEYQVVEPVMKRRKGQPTGQEEERAIYNGRRRNIDPSFDQARRNPAVLLNPTEVNGSHRYWNQQNNRNLQLPRNVQVCHNRRGDNSSSNNNNYRRDDNNYSNNYRRDDNRRNNFNDGSYSHFRHKGDRKRR